MKKLILLFFTIFFSNHLLYGQEKDTLFLSCNDKLLLKKWKDPISKELSYGIKGTGNNGLVYLLEIEIYDNLKHKKKKSLHNIIEVSNSYLKNNKIRDWRLAKYLGNYTIFIVEHDKYRKVQVVHEIE